MSVGGAGRASDFFAGGNSGGPDRGRGDAGRALRSGSPIRQPAQEKPVRISVDLDRELYRFLKGYSVDAGAKGVAVVRALLEELRDDPELSARVLDRIEDA